MARKYSGKQTFNQMMAGLKAEKAVSIDESSDPDLHYRHLIIPHEMGQERHVDILFQKLSVLRKGEGTGAVIRDLKYVSNGEGRSKAFILRGRNLPELEAAVQQASRGLPLTYELREY